MDFMKALINTTIHTFCIHPHSFLFVYEYKSLWNGCHFISNARIIYSPKMNIPTTIRSYEHPSSEHAKF